MVIGGGFLPGWERREEFDGESRWWGWKRVREIGGGYERGKVGKGE